MVFRPTNLSSLCITLVLLVALSACTPASQLTPTLTPGASASPTQPEASPSTSSPVPNPVSTPPPAPTLVDGAMRRASPDGRWTAILDRVAGSLVLEDAQGVQHTVFPGPSVVGEVKWSPQGRHLAVVLGQLPAIGDSGLSKGLPEIHLIHLERDAFSEAESVYRPEESADAMTAPGQIILGAWSPDGSRLLFWSGPQSVSIQADGLPLWVLEIDGMRATPLARAALVNPAYQSWAPDSRALVFTNGGYRSAQVGKWLSLYEVVAGQTNTLVAQDALVPGQVAWSPAGDSGGMVAFAAVEAGKTGMDWADWVGWDNPAILARRIYLLDPQTGEYRRLNASEAYQDAPRWSADGKKLYYVQLDGNQAVLLAADPATGEALPPPGCKASLPNPAGYYGQVGWTALYDHCQVIGLEAEEHIDDRQTYSDPAEQFRVSFPAEWQPGEEEGVFYGKDGSLQVGYLPEMAFMGRAYRVCERLANPPQGPSRKTIFYPIHDLDACVLVPLPEMSSALVRLVVANMVGEPAQRYFYLEADQEHFEAIADSLELLNKPPEGGTNSYSSGPMRPEEVSFWGQPNPLPQELTVEEYALVEASEDSPTHFEFMQRIPDEVFQKRAAWRGGFEERRLAGNNALLAPFGYSLNAKDGSQMHLYQLYRGDELLLDDINAFWPVSINASGSDFALVVETWNEGYRLARNGSLGDWDMGASWYIPPIFSGQHLLSIYWDSARSQVQVRDGDETIYSFASVFLTSSPVKGLWRWQDHWLVEIDGFLIQDGENQNERLGFEEIFGWQLLNGQPFYYFRKGPRVGISYAGQVLPLYYDEIVHYRCCGPAAFNNAGNETMIWFYGLRDGTWYYVEIGKYD
jgi:hypothetical protein